MSENMTVVFLLTYTLQYIFDKKHKLYSNIENRKLNKLNKLKLRWHGRNPFLTLKQKL